MKALIAAVITCCVLTIHPAVSAQRRLPEPSVRLASASRQQLPGRVDSNSPAVWALVDGHPTLSVMTSFAGEPSVSSGGQWNRMGPAAPVDLVPRPNGGVWMESIIPDEAGPWYGFYHNEVTPVMCGNTSLVLPRIGAARSTDGGHTWEDLGIILEAPPGQYACDTPNRYFVGGVGDLNAILDQTNTYVYLYFSQYGVSPSAQGVALARLPWADRDAPVGEVDIWVDGVWQPPALIDATEPDMSRDDAPLQSLAYPAGTSLFPVQHPWHDADPVDDAFWGASIHWNTALRQYVMLLNRTKNEQFDQEGVYVSFSPTIDDPATWSVPKKILSGGAWYPQVMGLENGTGTDKVAGASPRFFIGGVSEYVIEFREATAPVGTALPK